MKVEEGRESFEFLDADEWRSLAAAVPVGDFAYSWLNILCRMLPHARTGVVVVLTDGEFSVLAQWPEQGADVPRALRDVVEAALDERTATILREANASTTAMAYPIFSADEIHAVAGLLMADASPVQIQSAMRLMQWGGGWLQSRGAREAGMETDERALSILSAVLERQSFWEAVHALVTELALAWSCERVCFGRLRKNGEARLEATSFQSDFDRRTRHTREIETVMDEVLAEGEAIRWPEDDADELLIAHRQYAKSRGAVFLLGFPVFVNQRPWGVLLLERDDRPFSEREKNAIAVVCDLVGPWLKLTAEAGQSLPSVALQRFRRQWSRLFGSGYWLRKALVAGLSVALLALAAVPGEFRIGGEATLEGLSQRIVAAPFDGYVDKAFVRAGDRVKKGQALCRMDERDLRLEESKWLSKLAEARDAYRKALADRDKVKIRVGQARVRQAEAELALVRRKLSRMVLRAPFDGLVVKGDLSQALGSPKRKGEELFTIAPVNQYRVAVFIPEYDVANAAIGQAGELRLAAMPSRPLRVRLARLTSVAEVKDGINTFRAEAMLVPGTNHAHALRPGLKGVCKFIVDRRAIGWIWFHHLWQWLRLKFWEWTP